MEDQVDQQAQRDSPPVVPRSTEDSADRASKLRERQALELQRERILDERTASPIRRAALEAALSEIEKKLTAL